MKPTITSLMLCLTAPRTAQKYWRKVMTALGGRISITGKSRRGKHFSKATAPPASKINSQKTVSFKTGTNKE